MGSQRFLVGEMMTKSFVHPYIPNSTPKIKKDMMEQIGIQSIEELYIDVPRKFRVKKKLNIPNSMSEHEVKRFVETLLSKNVTNQEVPMFLGAGCWPHYVPAVVEEIIQRTELLTSYTPYQSEISQGLLQALFEYQSMICEITGMEVANSSMYDWASALGEAVRMAARLTNRTEALVPRIIHPERLKTLQTYSDPAGIRIHSIDYESETGQLDTEDLKKKISQKTAAIYIENPTYLGFIEMQAKEIAEEAHDYDCIFIVGVDPTSLGVLKPPSEYGADIVVGEGQPLGAPMNYGGPLLGNICSNEALCSVAAAVHLALLGPKGLKELGETIMSKTQYAMDLLAKIRGIKTPVFKSPHFKEFTVNFDNAGKTVREIHEKLLQHQVHGGKEVTEEFPELGETALYCVTEVHSKDDIDLLASALEEIVGEG